MAPLPTVLAARFVRALGTGGKRERTRAQLVHAAAHVFADRGWSQATIAEVAEAAGVTTGTVYNHFASKEEIAQALALALAATVNEAIVESIASVTDAAQRMAVGQRRFVWLAGESPSWARLLLDMAAIAPEHMRDIAQEALRDLRLGVRQKRFKVPSEESAMEVVTGVPVTAMRRVAAGNAPPRHDVACAALVLRALGVDAAEAMEIAKRPLPELPLPAG